jgi:hypothetical protein
LFGAMLAAEAGSDPARYSLAEQAFAKAAQSSDVSLEVVALRRLENAARAAGDTAAADEAARSLQTAESPSARSLVPSGLTMVQPGCTKDIECKGDRICEGQRCVAPR